MRRALFGLLLLLLVCGTWGLYRVGYVRGFVVAQRIGYQQQLNDVMLLLLSRQRMLASDPAAARCEVETLVRSQLTLLALEERGFQRDITWRDILQDMGGVEKQVKGISMPSIDQIKDKFNVHDGVPTGC